MVVGDGSNPIPGLGHDLQGSYLQAMYFRLFGEEENEN
jgi:hypothetical protein